MYQETTFVKALLPEYLAVVVQMKHKDEENKSIS